MRFLRRRSPGPQPVRADDSDLITMLEGCGHAVTPEQRDQLAAADERWLLHGEDGSPVGVAYLRRDAAQPGLVHAWMAVDPVLRRFGTGEKLWEHVLVRARKLKATHLASWADNQSGYAFLVDHGFKATTTGEDPASDLADRPRVDGVLDLATLD